jgi:excisionase family DNA binding protein
VTRARLAAVLRSNAETLLALAAELEDRDDDLDDDMIGVTEVAGTLSVAEVTVHRALKDHRLHGLKVGNRWRIPRSELARVAREGL